MVRMFNKEEIYQEFTEIRKYNNKKVPVTNWQLDYDGSHE
jgi:hypothetical protein